MFNLLVSVIVVTKNSERTLKRCLDSISEQTYLPIEIIVVDAESTDGTIKILKNYNIKHIVVNQNTSIGSARQVGFNNSNGEIIAYIDSDVELPHHKWIVNMCKPFSNPVVAGVQTLAKCRDSDPAILKKVHSKFEYKNRYIDIDNYEPVGTSHLLLRRIAISSVGGFIDSNFGEDVDLTLKIMNQGHGFVYLKNEKCYHHHVSGYKSYLKKSIRNKYYGIKFAVCGKR